MDFGDGSYETRRVEPGTDVVTFSFFHEYAPYFGAEVLEQRATIVETGRSSVAYTVHPDPFAHPGNQIAGDSATSCAG
jgi:hypothetical protein